MSAPLPNFHPAKRVNVPAAPPWVDDYIKPVNQQIKTITEHLQYRGDLLLEMKVRHATIYNVDVSGLADEPIGGTCLYSAVALSQPMALEILQDKKVRLTFTFEGSPTGEVFVRVRIEGR